MSPNDSQIMYLYSQTRTRPADDGNNGKYGISPALIEHTSRRRRQNGLY